MTTKIKSTSGPNMSQILRKCREIQSNWSDEERAARHAEGEVRRLELAELLGVAELELQAA